MKQYLELLDAILSKGTYKPAARENMPGTKSLFGYQFRHNLREGFPLLTTKEVDFKNIVVELMWFLKGDSNIKYLVDNGVNIWNEDAYKYYLKQCEISDDDVEPLSLDAFIAEVKKPSYNYCNWFGDSDYIIGDTGYQYPKVWRNWTVDEYNHRTEVDQIQNVINSLRNNPESRRHIVTAVDPAHDTDLALYWCHSMFQFNARPLHKIQRIEWAAKRFDRRELLNPDMSEGALNTRMDKLGVPKYYLDCQLYQRSADVILGVPYNIASYALLIHIMAKLTGMIPGEFIHTFGDVHIYDNHMEAVNTQIIREPTKLPTIEFHRGLTENGLVDLETFLSNFTLDDVWLNGYEPQEKIKAKLSTGLK